MELSSWIGTAYLLSVCAFTPLYGRLCDIIGRRASCLLAGSLFGVGMYVSSSLRVVQGVFARPKPILAFVRSLMTPCPICSIGRAGTNSYFSEL
jgi:MFS family permease